MRPPFARTPATQPPPATNNHHLHSLPVTFPEHCVTLTTATCPPHTAGISLPYTCITIPTTTPTVRNASRRAFGFVTDTAYFRQRPYLYITAHHYGQHTPVPSSLPYLPPAYLLRPRTTPLRTLTRGAHSRQRKETSVPHNSWSWMDELSSHNNQQQYLH